MAKALWKEFSYEQLKQFYDEAESINDFARKLGYAKHMTPETQKRIKETYPDLDLSKIARTPENKIGKTFGNFTILSQDLSIQKHYFCKCNLCGNIKSINWDSLKVGHTKSCGCMTNKWRSESNREDLTGQVFGYLTVLSYEGSTYNRQSLYKCRCNLCGSEKNYRAGNLTSGNTMSCGCRTISHGEIKILDILQSLNIEYIIQKEFEDLKGSTRPLRFDFYLPKDNICIEYQGEQHYKDTSWGGTDGLQKRQEYDQKKRDYCQSHNIKLIEIPYWDYDKLDEDYLCNLINS